MRRRAAKLQGVLCLFPGIQGPAASSLAGHPSWDRRGLPGLWLPPIRYHLPPWPARVCLNPRGVCHSPWPTCHVLPSGSWASRAQAEAPSKASPPSAGGAFKGTGEEVGPLPGHLLLAGSPGKFLPVCGQL